VPALREREQPKKPAAQRGGLQRRRFGVHADHNNYKWWALSCTSLGMLLATVNSGTLIIALPTLKRSLHTNLLELVWVILAYMIASTVLVLTAGRLSDMFGRKRAYLGGFLVFAIGSLGAGFAANGTELILWRILQGIGGAFLFANAAAIVTDAFPREQLGLAMGTNTMVAAVGLVIGPVLGGALVAIAWQWVFWFNVPLALAGTVWGAVFLREISGRETEREWDMAGTVTFTIGLTGLVLGITKGGISGWGSPTVLCSLLAAAVLLPAFVVIERRHRAPMLDRRGLCVPQRARPLRADVRLRLLLPRRAGRHADHGGREARAAGDRHARLLAAGRDLGGPPRLVAADGGPRDARDRRGDRAHDDDAT